MGELLEKVIRKKGLNISELARDMGVHRRSLYNWFREPQLKSEIMEKIAAVINTKELTSPDQVDRDDEYWKNKYIDLLERYAKLAEQHLDC